MANVYLMEILNETTKAFMESKYIFPTIGVEIRGKGSLRYKEEAYAISENDIYSGALIKKIQNEFNHYGASVYRTYDLTNEEYYIKNGSIIRLNIWGKVSKIVKENKFKYNGTYIVIHDNKVVEIELSNNSPWGESSELTITKLTKHKLDELADVGTADELQVLYVPKYHMWKCTKHEQYPDDPGCGIYYATVDIMDKATNELSITSLLKEMGIMDFI